MEYIRFNINITKYYWYEKETIVFAAVFCFVYENLYKIC